MMFCGGKKTTYWTCSVLAAFTFTQTLCHNHRLYKKDEQSHRCITHWFLDSRFVCRVGLIGGRGDHIWMGASVKLSANARKVQHRDPY